MIISRNNSHGGIIRVCTGIFTTAVHKKSFFMHVGNLEMVNSLKWVLFIKVSGQIIGNTLWK